MDLSAPVFVPGLKFHDLNPIKITRYKETFDIQSKEGWMGLDRVELDVQPPPRWCLFAKISKQRAVLYL